uniref:7TM_GPCR_Srx domain-containing protein n=1 Tax=Steinernema glaseri TaxID=37863 RepID=A0A1I7YD40_9BILA
MKISIAIVWTIAACQAAPYFNYDCTLQLDMKSQTFQFLLTPCTPFVALYFDWYYSLCLISLITTTDLVTLWKITQMKTSPDEDRNRRRSRDRRFFFQTITQGTIIIAELTFYFYISTLVSNKWTQFAMTTFAWILAHTLDGCIVILFNRELRSLRLNIAVTTSESSHHGRQTVATTYHSSHAR